MSEKLEILVEDFIIINTKRVWYVEFRNKSSVEVIY